MIRPSTFKLIPAHLFPYSLISLFPSRLSPLASPTILANVPAMSLESVRAFLADKAPDIEIIVTEQSSATVELAAQAHGVEPAQIAKTICVRVGEQAMLIVAGGTARLDNKKFKAQFSGKPRMLGAEEVVELTSHPVGGVCPFGVATPMPIYCDESLRAFDEVVPAAGATNAAVRIGTERLAEITDASWVDVCQ